MAIKFRKNEPAPVAEKAKKRDAQPAVAQPEFSPDTAPADIKSAKSKKPGKSAVVKEDELF